MKKSEARILTVHPTLQVKAFELIKKAYSEGIYILITQGLRTKAEQDALYAKGRRGIPGEGKVTYVKYPNSYHCWGLAIDFAVYTDKNCNAINWTVDSKWKRVGAIGKSLGLEWGGDWSDFKDYPHFQLTFGLTIKDLVNGAKIPEGGNTVEKQKEQTLSSWAVDAQKWVKENGFSDGTRPLDKVSREELWTILYRYDKAIRGGK